MQNFDSDWNCAISFIDHNHFSIFHSVYGPDPGHSAAVVAHIGGNMQPSGPATGPQGNWPMGQVTGQNSGQFPITKMKLKFSILNREVMYQKRELTGRMTETNWDASFYTWLSKTFHWSRSAHAWRTHFSDWTKRLNRCAHSAIYCKISSKTLACIYISITKMISLYACPSNPVST